MSKILLRIADSIFTFVITAFLLAAGAYACYALVDNQRIYTAAESVQLDLMQYKPKEDAGDANGGFSSFEALWGINTDVCGWLSLEGTKIDYPILWNQDLLYYINHDIYKKFSLAGSIFLDNRNATDFSDAYSLIYGHHMEKSRMFGDLDLYKDETFFREHKTGSLLLPEGSYELKIAACLVTASSEDRIFDPTLWKEDVSGLVEYIRKNEIASHLEVMDELEKEGENAKIVALSTCSSEFSEARTVVIAAMVPKGNS